MSDAPVHEVAETAAFTRARDRLGVSETECRAMLDVYASDPEHGQRIRGAGGLRKGRVAREGGGKSGGYRVFSVFFNRDLPVYLVWVIAKTVEETITDDEKAQFKKVITAIRQELAR